VRAHQQPFNRRLIEHTIVVRQRCRNPGSAPITSRTQR
jgi:hypothetical protein